MRNDEYSELNRAVTTLTTSQAEDVPQLRITPSAGWVSLKLHELWEYRELLYFLVWRDIKVRYKQTTLGVAWAIIQPFLTMVVFSVFFGRLAKFLRMAFPTRFSALRRWCRGLFLRKA